MIVLDETVKSKALICLVFSNLLLVLAQENISFEKSKFFPQSRLKKDIEEEESKTLKINKQITVILPGKEVRVFQYLDIENHDHNLSVTVIPCSSTIKWSFIYRTLDELKKQNSSAFFQNGGASNTYEIASMKTVTIEKARKGWYFVVFYPLGADSLVSVYMTMDAGGPYELTIPQKSNIILTPQRRQRLKVTWEQSLINPQNTSYCLVVNTKKEYSSLCAAEEEGPIIKGLEVPMIVNLGNLKLEKRGRAKYAKIERGMKASNDTVIVCVNHKVQLTFSKMKKGVKYFFNLFAINNKTNLTIPYGRSFIRYNFNARPALLKDGVRKMVDLRKMEGKTAFRFKVNKATKELDFYVIACGGAVDVEIKAKGLVKRRGRKAKEFANSLPKQTRVFGYKRFKISNPAEGEQYYLKVNAPNVDELTRIKYVEVFVTLYPTQRYPLPLLPDDPNLYEFKSQKTCNSVTIGWIPVYDASINTYCVLVWENRIFSYADFYRGYFQCNLDTSPKSKPFWSSPGDSSVSSECEDMITTNKKSITNYKIRDLKPGTSYTIQVTVKKKKGRTLSYKYLKVYTKHTCDY